MPWKYANGYVLFVIDHEKEVITIFDFTPTPDWCKSLPVKRYWEAIILISRKYNAAYNVKHSEWAHNVYKWEHKVEPYRPIDFKRYFLNTHNIFDR